MTGPNETDRPSQSLIETQSIIIDKGLFPLESFLSQSTVTVSNPTPPVCLKYNVTNRFPLTFVTTVDNKSGAIFNNDNTKQHNKQYHLPPEDVLNTTSSLGALVNIPSCSSYEIVVMVTVYCILGFNPLIVTVLL